MTLEGPSRPEAATDPGRGRRLGIDVGTVRIGVALSDPDGILASPLETVPATGPIDRGDIARIVELAEENFVVEIIVGFPAALSGRSTASTEKAVQFARHLAGELPQIPTRLADERMSTVAATTALRMSGVNSKKGRKKIDQAAAVHILQGWLDSRRALGVGE